MADVFCVEETVIEDVRDILVDFVIVVDGLFVRDFEELTDGLLVRDSEGLTDGLLVRDSEGLTDIVFEGLFVTDSEELTDGLFVTDIDRDLLTELDLDVLVVREGVTDSDGGIPIVPAKL